MRIVTLLLSLLVAACASTHAKQYLGKSVTEIMVAEGAPAHVFNLPDGRRVFQWYWGGGTVVYPGTANTTIDVIGDTAYATTTTTPGYVYSSRGCLLSYIARRRDGQWIVEEVKWPQRLIC